ncbi:hypothetical protein GJAV_G00110200 [Gymnothorax javanicus]|nr:hypothetical protein GJAV_G00110200 [Gymnothorax javanicus]
MYVSSGNFTFYRQDGGSNQEVKKQPHLKKYILKSLVSVILSHSCHRELSGRLFGSGNIEYFWDDGCAEAVLGLLYGQCAAAAMLCVPGA